jgi:hypothetical protein
VAPPVVREKFDREFYPGGLKTELSTNRFKVISPLFDKRVINKKQWALLYPGTGKLLSRNITNCGNGTLHVDYLVSI